MQKLHKPERDKQEMLELHKIERDKQDMLEQFHKTERDEQGDAEVAQGRTRQAG